jgi:hypothetical protein
MPYLVNGYTHNIYPLKLHEYLASGKPVVGTPIRSLQDFTHVLQLASTVDDWCAALARALAPGLVGESAARQEVARKYDWSELIHRIAERICAHLNPELRDRLRLIDFAAAPPVGPEPTLARRSS